MTREEYTEFHRLLALLKYDILVDLISGNLTDKTSELFREELEAIDKVASITRIKPEKEDITCINM